jgi:cytochrome c-type biogenesis protein CcmF
LRYQQTSKWIPFGYLSVLFTTLMVRSGALTSIHSFADDPMRGQIFGIYCIIVLILAAGALYRDHATHQKQSSLLSTALSYKKILTGGCIGIVLVGVLYPLIQSIYGHSIILGETYFTATLTPLLLPLLFGIIFSPWYRDPQKILRILPVILLSCVLILLLFYKYSPLTFMNSVVATLSFITFITSLWGVLRLPHKMMHVSHMGFSMMCIGIVLSAAFTVEKTVVMHKMQSVCIENYHITIGGPERQERGNHYAVIYPIMIERLGTLKPELRYYTSQSMVHAETSILNHRLHQLYAAVSEEGKNCVLQIHIKPYINIMWGGIIMMVIGILGSILKSIMTPNNRTT